MPGQRRKRLAHTSIWAFEQILFLLPDIERDYDIIRPYIQKYGGLEHLRALERLSINLAEIERVASDGRRGQYRERGEKFTEQIKDA